MSRAKHTPTPWICAEETRPLPDIATVGRVGDWVFGVSTPGYPGGDYRSIDCEDPAGGADVAFIVRACNSHDALVAALEKAQHRLATLRVCVPTYAMATYLLDCKEISAALKAARP